MSEGIRQRVEASGVEVRGSGVEGARAWNKERIAPLNAPLLGDRPLRFVG